MTHHPRYRSSQPNITQVEVAEARMEARCLTRQHGHVEALITAREKCAAAKYASQQEKWGRVVKALEKQGETAWKGE